MNSKLNHSVRSYKKYISEYRWGFRFTKKNHCVILRMLILLNKNLTKLTKEGWLSLEMSCGPFRKKASSLLSVGYGWI